MSILNIPILHIFIQCLMVLFTVQTFFYHFPNLTFKFYPFPTSADLFKLHPFCMCLGFILCFSESIWLFHPIYRLPKKKWIHYGLNTTGTVLASFGIGAILYKKEMDSIVHFISWHGTLGIITFVHAISQFLAGWLLPLPENRIISSIATRKTLKYLHRLSGCMLIFEIFLVFVLSCYTTWFNYVSKYDFVFYVNIWFYSVVTVVSIGLVLPKLLGKKNKVKTAKNT